MINLRQTAQNIWNRMRTPVEQGYQARVSRVGELAGRVAPRVQTALQSAKESVLKRTQQITRPIGGFITDLPANRAYLSAKVSQKMLPPDFIPTAEQLQQGHWDIIHEKKFPYSLSQGPIKSMSAQLNPYPVVPSTSYNQQLEAIKQRILNSGVFRPAMKRYLSTVPILGYYGEPGVAATDVSPYQTYDIPASYPEIQATGPSEPWETSQGPYGGQPLIEMEIAKNQPIPSDEQFKSVLVHELIHASPRNMRFKNEFINFFSNITPETQPMLYEVGLQYLQNGQPPPNPEEFYATLGQHLGPNVLNIPEVRKFYENIFKYIK